MVNSVGKTTFKINFCSQLNNNEKFSLRFMWAGQSVETLLWKADRAVNFNYNLNLQNGFVCKKNFGQKLWKIIGLFFHCPELHLVTTKCSLF